MIGLSGPGWLIRTVYKTVRSTQPDYLAKGTTRNSAASPPWPSRPCSEPEHGLPGRNGQLPVVGSTVRHDGRPRSPVCRPSPRNPLATSVHRSPIVELRSSALNRSESRSEATRLLVVRPARRRNRRLPRLAGSRRRLGTTPHRCVLKTSFSRVSNDLIPEMALFSCRETRQDGEQSVGCCETNDSQDLA